MHVGDLKPGALVHEAELKLTADGPVWDEITLVRPAVPHRLSRAATAPDVS